MILNGKTIFLLEDDPVNFSVILTIMRRHGAATIHDHWGDTTLARLLDNSYLIDLILLDLMLPGKISGYDVFDAIKATPELSDVPIVAVTASDPDVEMPKTKAKGFNGYISKPINRYKFPKQLNQVLNGVDVWE
ncbi:MAG: response regulator [Chloroflexi bacterium]|nr:response regulator [Chloroflexota bacterium]